MKKHLLILCFLLGFFKVDAFAAYDFEFDGVRYNIISTKELTCEVAGIDKNKKYETITIPSTATYSRRELKVVGIAKEAFSQYSYLKEINIPNSVKNIAEKAFWRCYRLERVVLPDSVEYIGKKAFAEITALKEVSLGRCKTIDDYAFHEAKIVYLSIPSSVESIGAHAFEDCINLKNVTIYGESLKSIGNNAFYNCTNLESINIPKSVTNLGGSVFQGSSKIVKFNIEDLYSYLKINYSSAPCPSKWELYVNNERITKLEIPVGIDSLKSSVFRGCKSIKEISFPNTLKVIQGSVFENCDSLIGCTITIPSSVVLLTEPFSCTLRKIIIEDSHENCRVGGKINAKEAYIGRNIDGTGKFLCEKITTGPCLTSIPKGIFNSSVEYLTISDIIGNEPLSFEPLLNEDAGFIKEECPNLRSLYLGGVEVIPDGLFANRNILNEVVLGNSVKVIGNDAFRQCPILTSVSLGNSVESIGNSAFYECYYLYCMILPNSVKTIGSSAFYGCSALSYINIPNSVSRIDNYAFYGCKKLEAIVIGESVKSIGSGAFKACTALKHVTIPASVETIGIDAFASSNPENLVIRDRETYLDLSQSGLISSIDTLYLGMSNLDYLYIPNVKYLTLASNVKNLPHIRNWDGLRTIISLAPTPPTAIFTDLQYFGVDVYVPEGCLDKYMADDNWDDFFFLSEIDSEYFTLEQNSFSMYCNTEHTINVSPNAYNESIVWSSSDPNIATVENGKVTAHNKGSVTITAKLGNTIQTCDVYVRESSGTEVVGISLSDVNVKLAVGDTKILVTTVYPSTLAETTKIWSSSNEAVATVDANGVVTAVAPGAAFITVKCGNAMGICNVNVIPPYVLGDVTGDEQIAVDDVVYTISYVIGIADDDFNDLAADMNSDGLVLIDDVVLIIDAVLGIDNVYMQNARDYAGKQKIRTENAEAWDVDVVAESDNRSIVGVALDNKEKYVAMQFDMCLSDGITMNDIKLAGCSDHAVVFNELEDGVVRVLVTSLSNECFAKDNKLNIDIVAEEEGTVSFTNAYAVTAQRAMSSLANIDVNITRGTTNIKTNSETIVPSNIYDLKGRLVKENATSTDGLKKGIYLMNGKKILVK